MNNSWVALRQFTQARIALGRAGHAVTTQAMLDFQLAHAQARDAVHAQWNITDFASQVRQLGKEVLTLETAISCREEYLQRPDLGRVLSDISRTDLKNVKSGDVDVALIVTNGLSSTAVELHGIAVLQEILSCYRISNLRVAPIILIANGRVALSDDIGSVLGARVAVIIVGERPGLSAADSLGIYLTYGPRPGNTDAERNCISNIRPPEGLCYQDAAAKLRYLTEQALRLRTSGVALKDDMESLLRNV